LVVPEEKIYVRLEEMIVITNNGGESFQIFCQWTSLASRKSCRRKGCFSGIHAAKARVNNTANIYWADSFFQIWEIGGLSS